MKILILVGLIGIWNWIIVCDVKNHKIPVMSCILLLVMYIFLYILQEDQTCLRIYKAKQDWYELGIIFIVLSLLSFIFKTKIGIGDFLLVGILGVYYNVFCWICIIMYASLTSAMVSGVLLLTHRIKKTDCLPFSPFLLVGIILFNLLNM